MRKLKNKSCDIFIQNIIYEYVSKYLTLSGLFSCQICTYNLSDFRDLSFEDFDVYCPESISDSVIKRRAEFYYGRLAAKYALSKIGIVNYQVKIGNHREPIWPDNINGSITHTDKIAAAIVTDINSISIGIDIENIIEEELVLSIKNHIVSAKELEFLNSQKNYLAFKFLFTMVFSAKEAFYKAIFPLIGHYIGFNAVKIRDIDWLNNVIVLELNESLSGTLVNGYLCYVFFKVVNSSVITLCLIDRNIQLNPI